MTASGGRFAFACAAAILLAACLPGCRGCQREDPLEVQRRREEAEKKQRDKPPEDFETGRIHLLPRDDASLQNLVKPGHWAAAWQPAKANHFDFQGEWVSASTRGAETPLAIPDTRFRMTVERPAALPKGQNKLFETLFYIPETSEADAPAVWLENRLRWRGGGREVKNERETTTRMPEYQAYLVVLADNPDRYGFLSGMHSTETGSAGGLSSFQDTARHYRVLRPQSDTLLPLPAHPLCWSTLAYVLWDGMSPERLSLDQQQAMLDWLHWGGQIVISGPRSLGLLRASFLEPYLPSQVDESIELSQSDLQPLAEAWSIQGSAAQARRLEIPAGEPLVGVRLEPSEDAQPLPGTNSLVFERRVGRGRIVATAFSLADRPLVRWDCFDSFFNACLLRRPPRVFAATEGVEYAAWRLPSGSGDICDSRLVTRLRYLARDAAAATDPGDPWLDPVSVGGPASWHGRSPAAAAARETLRDAAGIRIPQAGFVFRTLAAYLAVLVPLNWLVFRLLGRLEWAWIAAPVIAVAGAIAVVRLAQLDIGFARSRTEVSILELQGGYPRGHVTRYTALYASLSTSYDLSFDDPSALALPLAEVASSSPPGDYRSLVFRRGRKQVLSDFLVASNSIGNVRSEQLMTFPGAIAAQPAGDSRWMLENGTELVLQGAGVIRGAAGGRVEQAWVGTLPALERVPLRFADAGGQRCFAAWVESPIGCSPERALQLAVPRIDRDGDGEFSAEEWNAVSPAESARLGVDHGRPLRRVEFELAVRSGYSGVLSLGRLLDLACDGWPLREGDLRLIGWTDQPIAGLAARPEPAQFRGRTLVVVHLRYGSPPAAVPDQNLPQRAEVADEELDSP